MLIGILMLISLGLTFVQIQKTESVELSSAVGTKRDIKAGERIQAEDLEIIQILPENQLPDGLKETSDVVGKIAVVDLTKGVIARGAYFKEPDDLKPKAGNAMTAIKLLPDSAVCWVMESGQRAVVYFIDDQGEMEILGEVEIRKNYDQRMSDEDLYFFVVVEGKEEIIEKIVQKRTLGRLEIVKKQ